MWALVGEARNPVYKEFNEHGVLFRIDNRKWIEPERL